MQGSRAECALARSVRKLIVLYFFDFHRRIVDALNIVSLQGSRAKCALARSVRKLIVLYFYNFRRRIVDALNIVSLCTQKIAMTVTRLSICSH